MTLSGWLCYHKNVFPAVFQRDCSSMLLEEAVHRSLLCHVGYNIIFGFPAKDSTPPLQSHAY